MNDLSIDLVASIAFNIALAGAGYAIPIIANYERVLSEHLVLSVAPGILCIHQSTQSSVIGPLWIELDWHPFQKGLQGFYVGTAVVVVYLDIPSSKINAALTAMVGVGLGYQIPLPANLDADIALGAAFGSIPGGTDAGAFPRASIALGYRF